MDCKKIAFISYHTCPLSDEKDAEIGGMNTYILGLATAMTQKGYIIDIYTRCVDISSPGVVNINPNLRIIHLIAGQPMEIPKAQLDQHINEFLKNLYQFIGKEKLSYQLLNAHYYLSGLIGLEIKKKYHIPLLITFHTLAVMRTLVAREGENKYLKRIKAELLLAAKADKVIATSESDLEYIHTLYSCPLEKITVLTPGVDLKLFRPIDKRMAKEAIAADLNHKLILFVGRIEPFKGIDVILYAIKILVQKRPKPSFCLWIVGGNINNKSSWSRELERLDQIRTLLEIKSYVRFVGKKSREELPYYYNAAELVLLPSQYESFGITAIEAMACGIPVIISDVAGVSGLLDKKHRSLLTSASNPIGLAKKITNLLTNDIKHKKMSDELFTKVRDLSWENVADQFTQILTDKLHSR